MLATLNSPPCGAPHTQLQLLHSMVLGFRKQVYQEMESRSQPLNARVWKLSQHPFLHLLLVRQSESPDSRGGTMTHFSGDLGHVLKLPKSSSLYFKTSKGDYTVQCKSFYLKNCSVICFCVLLLLPHIVPSSISGGL